jgi:type VI secretion system secreted protein VgrG
MSEQDLSEKIADAAHEVAGGLESIAGEETDRTTLTDGIQAASEVAEATSEGAKTASAIGDVAHAAREGRTFDAVGSSVGALGHSAGATSELASGIATVAPGAREPLENVSRIARTVQQVSEAVEKGIDIVEDIVDAVRGDGNRVVRWEFETDAYADHEWSVASASVKEALNEPYCAIVTVHTGETDTDPMEVLGKNCTVTWRRGDLVQHAHGLALKVIEHPLDERQMTLTVEIAPALALLSQRRNSRVFQQKNVPDILKEVLEEALGPYEREVKQDLSETYDEREYCLQFDETDLAFVHRLMEEEGIFYSFEQDGDKEVLFLFDKSATGVEVETLDGGDVPFDADTLEVSVREPIARFQPTNLLTPTSLVLRDFDWTQQGNMRVDAEDKGQDARGKDREIYTHHQRVLTIDDYDAGVLKYRKHDADRQAKIRAELLRAPQRTAHGTGRVIGFRPGRRFSLIEHPSVGADHEYFLTRVEHSHDALPHEDGEHSSPESYHNRFEVQPADVAWRPDRVTQKPRIHSIQTAIVVGPSGEEIHTDEHGRIKVEFHWDRLGKGDEKSSCWVRVQQPWAGSGWGFVFIPRVGMEVLISFLDGDPDRPLCIGSVYNGTNRPPYPLPDEKTKSTIKTQSTPGGGGYNELRFEDKAGSEEIFTHAQKDYNEVVEHDHTTTVHNNQTNAIDCEHTETVGGNQSLTVDQNRTVHIKGSQSVTIDGGKAADGHTGSKLAITGKYKVDASEWIEEQAPDHIKLTCGGSSILIEPGKITLQAGGGAKVVLDANALVQSVAGSKTFHDANSLMVSSGGSQTFLDANALVAASGGAQVLFDANANMTSAGGSQVLLDGNAFMGGAADATVQGVANATVAAPTANLLGSGTTNVNGGTTNVGGGTTNVAGGTLNASGGTVNISGGLVKIN